MLSGTSSEVASYDDELDYEEDVDGADDEEDENSSGGGCCRDDEPSKDEDEEKVAALVGSFEECMCTEISEKLRINIRKKTEVRGSPSPEVTHTIRIAMKCHGGQLPVLVASREHPDGSRSEPSCETELPMEDPPEAPPMSPTTTSCCPGVSVALDFTLNCNSVQLTSRDVTVRPCIVEPQTSGKPQLLIKSAKD